MSESIHKLETLAGCVSALYVQPGGAYSRVGGLDVWDEQRDARLYDGPNSVVAHPPCRRWGKMYAGSPTVIAKTGQRKKLGDDGGCFKAALASVRKWGGVLEHPWGSHAWKHFGIAVPPRTGGWIDAGDGFGKTCCVEQGWYGHYAPKPTLLYAVRTETPELKWGKYEVKDSDFPAWAMERHGRAKCRRRGLLSFRGGGIDSGPRIHTPDQFRDLLLQIARTAPQGTFSINHMSESPHLVKNLVAMLRENGYNAHGFYYKNGLAGVSVEFSASGKNFSVGELFEDSAKPEKAYDHMIHAVERKKKAVLSGLE